MYFYFKGKRQLKDIAALMEKRDVLITDRAFHSLREHICLLCGWSKTRTSQLSEWQKQETKEISQQRGNLLHTL